MGYIWRANPQSRVLNALALLDELCLSILCACVALLDRIPSSSALGNIIVITIFFNISLRFIGIML